MTAKELCKLFRERKINDETIRTGKYKSDDLPFDIGFNIQPHHEGAKRGGYVVHAFVYGKGVHANHWSHELLWDHLDERWVPKEES